MNFFTHTIPPSAIAAGKDSPQYHEALRRLLIAGLFYAGLFLGDDKLGNDQNLNHDQRFYILTSAQQLLQRVAPQANPSSVNMVMTPTQIATLDAMWKSQTDTVFTLLESTLLEVKKSESDDFFNYFLVMLQKHLATGLAKQKELNPEKYILKRRDVSGMLVAERIIQFITQAYPAIRKIQQAAKEETQSTLRMRRLEAILSSLVNGLGDYGGISNDGVSLRKELEENTLFNYLLVITLAHLESGDELTTSLLSQYPAQLLEISYFETGRLLTDIDAQFHENVASFRHLIKDDSESETPVLNDQDRVKLEDYLAGLQQYRWACQAWQIHPEAGGQRYSENQALDFGARNGHSAPPTSPETKNEEG